LADIEWTEGALSDLERLDKPIARRILRRLTWFSKNFQSIVPEPLAGTLKGTFKSNVVAEFISARGRAGADKPRPYDCADM
jgi:hypothetical protein